MTSPVFIVDDDAAIRDALSLLLETANVPSVTYPDGSSFLASLDKDIQGCVLLDVAMPGMSGFEVLEAMHERDIRIPVIFLTGHGDAPMAKTAAESGAMGFLQKPIYGDDLIKQVKRAMRVDH